MRLTNNNIDKIQKEWLIRCIEANKKNIDDESMEILNIEHPDEINTKELNNLSVNQIAYIDLELSSSLKTKKENRR